MSDAVDALPSYLKQRIMITQRPAWQFGNDAAIEALTKHFSTARLDGFGFDDTDAPAIRAAGAVLANGGRRIQPRLALASERDGQRDDLPESVGPRVISERTARRARGSRSFRA